VGDKKSITREDVVLRRSLTYALLIGLLILIVIGLSLVVGSGPLVDSPIVLALYVAIVVILFEPLRILIQGSVDKYIFHSPTSFTDLLNAYSQDLTEADGTEQLASTLFKYTHIAIPDTTPQLFLPDETRGVFCSYGNDNSLLLDATSPVIQFMREQSTAVELKQREAWPIPLSEHSEEIVALGAAVIVPMNGDRELLGLLTLSEKKNRAHFRPAELNFLTELADRSSNGLERTNSIRQLEARIAELDLLSQFSQYLNFTIVIDDLLELAYTNHRRLLGIEDFFVYWKDPASEQVYTTFHVESDERIRDKEGRDKLVNDPRILQVISSGQMLTTRDETKCAWIVMPLNAGAETMGALHTIHREPGHTLPERQLQLLSVFADRTAVALDRLHTRQQLETRAEQLEIINQVTFSLASTLELDPLLNLILDKALELLVTEAGTFMLTDEDTYELEFRVVRGPASQDLLGTRLPIGTGLAGTAAQTGQTILVNRVREDKRWFDQVDASSDFQSESILTVPLLRQNTVLGVLQVINKLDGAPFNESDQMLLTAFAGQAVVALENARLLEQTDRELQERVNELFMLQQLDRDLNTTLDLDHVLSLTLNWILRICRGTVGAVALENGEGQLQLEAVSGHNESFDPESVVPESLKAGVVGSILESGEPFVSGNVHEDPDYQGITDTVHSQMSLPIIHKQDPIGVIVLGGDQFDAFDEATVEAAVRVTNHAAVAIANAILYEQVNEANLAKTEFVSMASHELKTPMTSVRGYTDLLLSGMTGELSQQQKGFLETIAANIDRMSKQIQDLTDISRIETGRLRMEPTPTAFTNIITETLQIVQGPCDSKNIELHLDLPADLPLILADKERLVQVLTNLLSNACKYSPEDTDVHVTFREEWISSGEERPPIPVVICSVKDDGYGISEEDQQNLFTKFFRAEDPNIRKATGTGLGLSITKGIIEFHGGKIWVESALGNGTTFHFSIPQAQG
jgi:signal transduction histidine kinase